MSWPLTGLFTDAAVAGLIAASAVIAIVLGLGRLGALRERQAARWLGLGLLWTGFALTVISPSLATVIPGLPNDHYHAFADPMVFTLVGLGAGALWRVRPSRTAAPPASPAELPDGPWRRPDRAGRPGRGGGHAGRPDRLEPRQPAACRPPGWRIPGRRDRRSPDPRRDRRRRRRSRSARSPTSSRPRPTPTP